MTEPVDEVGPGPRADVRRSPGGTAPKLWRYPAWPESLLAGLSGAS
jgi:hypothetical protein